MTDWYYVEGRERVGPVDEEKIISMIEGGILDEESFLWTKGFDDWKKLSEIPELKNYLRSTDQDDDGALSEDYPSTVEYSEEASIDDIPPFVNEGLDWNQISLDAPIFMIKIGLDRGTQEAEYGPYSLNQLKKAFDQNRINEKTYIFSNGMENWIFLADLPLFETVFGALPPAIDEGDRRVHTRKPFVARMFFHDNKELFEGICRDVSVGGLQILVADFPASVGDVITMNVHPDNSSYNFVAKGKVVRVLDGKQGFSLRFIELNDNALEAISNFIEE